MKTRQLFKKSAFSLTALLTIVALSGCNQNKTPTSTNKAPEHKNQVVSQAQNQAQPTEKQESGLAITDMFIKDYALKKENKVFPEENKPVANLLVYAYTKPVPATGLAPHAVVLQDKSFEDFRTNPNALVILEKNLFLDKDKKGFRATFNNGAPYKWCCVLTPNGITMYDIVQTLTAAKEGSKEPVKIVWHYPMEKIKETNIHKENITPTNFYWYGNEGDVVLDKQDQGQILIKINGDLSYYGIKD